MVQFPISSLKLPREHTGLKKDNWHLYHLYKTILKCQGKVLKVEVEPDGTHIVHVEYVSPHSKHETVYTVDPIKLTPTV